MKARGNITVEEATVTDQASIFQVLVVKAGTASVSGRVHLLARGLAMIAYAICDLADAVREHRKPVAVLDGPGPADAAASSKEQPSTTDHRKEPSDG